MKLIIVIKSLSPDGEYISHIEEIEDEVLYDECGYDSVSEYMDDFMEYFSFSRYDVYENEMPMDLQMRRINAPTLFKEGEL